MHKSEAVTFSTGKIHSAFAALDKNKCGKQLNRFFPYVLLTVHLSIVLVIDQLNAQILVL